jgi:hypothetical protein
MVAVGDVFDCGAGVRVAGARVGVIVDVGGRGVAVGLEVGVGGTVGVDTGVGVDVGLGIGVDVGIGVGVGATVIANERVLLS